MTAGATKSIRILTTVILTACMLLAVRQDPAVADDIPPIRIATSVFPSDIGNPYQALRLPTLLPTHAVFDPLTVIAADGRVQPWLATDWSSRDARIWTVGLRQGVEFSNGAPFTSASLVASFEHMQSPDGRSETIGSNLADIASVTADGPHAVTITLAAPDALFPIRLALWRIPDPDAWRHAPGGAGNDRVPGTGPYRIANLTSSEIVLAPNPHAWNPPATPSVVISLVADELARAQALASGGVDVAMALSPLTRGSIEGAGGDLVRRKMSTMPYVGFALEGRPDAPLHDSRIRLALNLAVDRTAIVDTLLDGLVEPANQLALPGAPGYVAELPPFAYEPERARALLAEAGFPDGIDLTLRLAPFGPDDLATYQQVASDMKAAGIRLTLQVTPVNLLTQMLFAGDMRGADLFTTVARGLDPLADYRIRACLGLTGSRKPLYCHPNSMPLFARAREAPTAAAAAALTAEALSIEHGDPPGIFLWSALALDGVGPDIAAPGIFARYYDFVPLHELKRQ